MYKNKIIKYKNKKCSTLFTNKSLDKYIHKNKNKIKQINMG